MKSLSLLLVIAPFALAAHHQARSPHRAAVHAVHEQKNATTGVETRDVAPLQKRFSNTRFSWFVTGLGACGGYNKPSDYIVALNTHQWNNGAHCNEEITISYKGKTRSARVVDLCMECPYGAIDMTEGLFQSLASLGEGYLYGSWVFGSGGPSEEELAAAAAAKAAKEKAAREAAEREAAAAKAKAEKEAQEAAAAAAKAKEEKEKAEAAAAAAAAEAAAKSSASVASVMSKSSARAAASASSAAAAAAAAAATPTPAPTITSAPTPSPSPKPTGNVIGDVSGAYAKVGGFLAAAALL